MSSPTRATPTRPPAPRVFPLKRIRFWIVCLFFLCWASAIGFRLFWLQVVRHQEFLARAEHLHTHVTDVAPRRGLLFDRGGRGLAMTVEADSIFADLNLVKDRPKTAAALASILHTDPDDVETSEAFILGRLNNGKSFAWIAHRIPADQADAIQKKKLLGIGSIKEFKRIYPANLLAAQVLGYVGTEDTGMAGLEAKFDSILHGKGGERSETLDRRRKALGSTETESLPGRNLTLTLDNNIQYDAEQALDAAMQRSQAKSGTVVVEDVHTGQILALATRPTFNPNQVQHPKDLPIANTAVSNVYEPGSTFKLVTYAAVLDQQLAQPNQLLDCSGGKIKIGGVFIHDDESDRGLGHLTVTQALEHSSDVCAVKMAMLVGPQHFYDYMKSFGFGSRSGIELPGETRGMLTPLKKWSPSTIGYFSIGQGHAVTPIQLASMVSTIANGGVYMPPHILIPDQPEGGTPSSKYIAAQRVRPGEELPNPLPQGAHRVISSMASAQMRQMMRGVVEEGTGKKAQLNGYSAGGKTGTAQKIETVKDANGKAHSFYSKTEHIASFAGFAPVNNPVIAVAVIMDSPKGEYYGAAVAAPVFREVAQSVLLYLGVPHDTTLHIDPNARMAPIREDGGSHDASNLDVAFNDLPDDDPLRNQPAAAPPTAATTPSGAQQAPMQPQPQLPTAAHVAIPQPGGRQVSVPKLTGLPVRKVIEQAGAAGLDVHISGSGVCNQQAPDPGTMVPAGTRVQVRCGR